MLEYFFFGPPPLVASDIIKGPIKFLLDTKVLHTATENTAVLINRDKLETFSKRSVLKSQVLETLIYRPPDMCEA